MQTYWHKHLYVWHCQICVYYVLFLILAVVVQDLLNALHLAAIGGHLEVVKYLMPKFGDSRFDLDNDAQSCLHKAVRGATPRWCGTSSRREGLIPASGTRWGDRIAYTNTTSTVLHISMCRMTWTASFWPATMVS